MGCLGVGAYGQNRVDGEVGGAPGGRMNRLNEPHGWGKREGVKALSVIN